MKPEEITAEMRERVAYNYVRQSTLRQIVLHTESARRQYGFMDRALTLGWPRERVITIDEDQGRSGSAPSSRSGFERLMSEVSLGRAGLVMALEASRLARNSLDWARLTQYCAITGTPILDETGLYNPADPVDCMALGVKGFTSETERNLIRSRMRGGVLSKAKRGEFRIRLPVGFVYREDGKVVFDPDRQVQDAVRHFFRTFRRTGTALGVVREFHRTGQRFPRRLAVGERKGQIVWLPLSHSAVLHMLHNPRYAGAYVYGRKQQLRLPEGKLIVRERPQERWVAFVRDAQPAYITWDDYEANVRRLKEAAQARGPEGKSNPPREGPALLQGLAICGKCGRRMSVRYGWKAGYECTYYVCNANVLRTGDRPCQSVHGNRVDEAIGELLVRSVTPLALEVALQVQREVEERFAEADRMRYQEVERTRYEADMARRRYLAVDPTNRLVAATLEADWNEKIHLWREAQETYQREDSAARHPLTDEERVRVRALATDVPRMWRDPRTPAQERKRVARLLVEDVTLVNGEKILASVRFRGGTTRQLEVPRPLTGPQKYSMPKDIVQAVDQMLDETTPAVIAQRLNERRLHPVKTRAFHVRNVQAIIRYHRLRPRYDRLRGKGLLTFSEAAKAYGVSEAKIRNWWRARKIAGYAFNDRPEWLFEPPSKAQNGEEAQRPQRV